MFAITPTSDSQSVFNFSQIQVVNPFQTGSNVISGDVEASLNRKISSADSFLPEVPFHSPLTESTKEHDFETNDVTTVAKSVKTSAVWLAEYDDILRYYVDKHSNHWKKIA